MCLCSVISVNPSMPVSCWRRLLKLMQKNTFTIKWQAGLRKLVDSIGTSKCQKLEGDRLNCIAVLSSMVNVIR